MPLDVLIVGAGVAGPALAFLLLRADPSHTITVIERAPALRQDGLQIDLRAQGLPVVRKMGLMPALRQHVVAEEGFAIVDAQGREWGRVGKNDSGKGQQSLTSEWEIMRGDLVRVLYDASLAESEKAGRTGNGGVRYEFNKSLVGLQQDPPRDSKVTAAFSDGTQSRYDLVVGADGQWSKTRRLLFGDDASAAMFRSLGLFLAYYTVSLPNPSAADAIARWQSAPGRRSVVTRSARAPSAAARPPRTQVYLGQYVPRSAAAPSELAAVVARGDDEQKRRAWARAFADLRPRGELDDDLDNFYAHEIGQVKCPRVAEGRVALLGDAGYCPAPVTGMGTTVSLVGAYVLAGELARHSRPGDTEGEREYDVLAALEAYDRVVRPFVDEAQKLNPGVPWIAYPESWWGVLLLNMVFRVLTWFRVIDIIFRLMPEDKGGLAIPEYPELNLEP
ncbi:monooxygenase [Biscogniauxia sp. FL1348]|nr:monooxygenase [Biscogniauxia sp. FL1348]